MAFKTCVKQLFRNPVKTLLYFLLLALACMLLCVSVGMLVSAVASAAEVDAAFTTIAVPNITRIPAGPETDQPAMDNLNSIPLATDATVAQVLEIAEKSRNVRQLEVRRRLRGVNPDISPYWVPAEKVYIDGEYVEYMRQEINHAMNLFVLEVTCELASETTSFSPVLNAEVKYYSADFKIDNVLSGQTDIHKLEPRARLHMEDLYEAGSGGKQPFEVGGRYIVWAQIVPNALELPPKTVLYRLWKSITPSRMNNQSQFTVVDGVKYTWVEVIEGVGFLPVAELKGSVDEFLHSQEGAVWRDIIEANTHSFEVMTTGALESILFFNQSTANIVDGRGFTDDEYDQGDKVCVISTHFAQLNRLQVGDKIDMKLNFTYEKMQNMGGNEYFWMIETFYPTNGYTEQHEFEVVGIYSTPEDEKGPFYIQPNTVIVPDKSIESKEGYPFVGDSPMDDNMYVYTPQTISIILNNGGLKGFKAELEEHGLEDTMLYFDQGYSRVSGTVSAFTKNAWILFAISAAAWAAVAMLFVYFYIIRQKKETGVMLSLGTGQAQSFRYILSCVIVISLAASIIGSAVGYTFYEQAVDASYELALKGDDKNSEYSGGGATGSYHAKIDVIKKPETVFMAAGVQFIVLAAASSLAAVYMVKRKPLRLIQDR